MKTVAYNAWKNGSAYIAEWLTNAMCEQVCTWAFLHPADGQLHGFTNALVHYILSAGSPSAPVSFPVLQLCGGGSSTGLPPAHCVSGVGKQPPATTYGHHVDLESSRAPGTAGHDASGSTAAHTHPSIRQSFGSGTG
jgi:hypothetical protein